MKSSHIPIFDISIIFAILFIADLQTSSTPKICLSCWKRINEIFDQIILNVMTLLVIWIYQPIKYITYTNNIIKHISLIL